MRIIIFLLVSLLLNCSSGLMNNTILLNFHILIIINFVDHDKFKDNLAYDLVLFDLDGTLSDSSDLIAASF